MQEFADYNLLERFFLHVVNFRNLRRLDKMDVSTRKFWLNYVCLFVRHFGQWSII